MGMDFVTGGPGGVRGGVEFVAGLLQATLAARGVTAIVAPAFDGPQVEAYTVSLGLGEQPERVERLAGALALAAGTSTCRVARAAGRLIVEVPKPEGERRMLLARRFLEVKATSPLAVPLGLGSTGEVVWLDMGDERTCHTIIGGTSGSGKTNALHWILFWLLGHNPVGRLGLLLLDPKGYELRPFWRVRHLLHPPECDPREIVKVLAWVQAEMGRRAAGEMTQIAGQERLELVVVIDEVRQLARRERRVQQYLGSIAELGRGVGIHLLVTAQQPGTKAAGEAMVNFPCRLLGRVASKTLEYGAAGRARTRAGDLLGRGDFLRLTADGVVRVQVPLIREEELARLPQTERVRVLELAEEVDLGVLELAGVDPRGGWNRKVLDEGEVREAVGEEGATATRVQQRFGINYYRAERLVESTTD